YYSESEVVALLESGRNGATWESVSPLPAHMPLPTSTTEILHIKECLTAEGGSWKTYPDVLPLDLVIFDNERILLGSNKDLKTGHHDAILDSTNPDLIAWADDLYETYRKDASGPLEYLF